MLPGAAATSSTTPAGGNTRRSTAKIGSRLRSAAAENRQPSSIPASSHTRPPAQNTTNAKHFSLTKYVT